MLIKRFLSWLFKRDYTARPMTAEERAQAAQYDADVASGKIVAPQAWSSDCSWGEILVLSANPSAYHRCCDGALSGVKNRRYACVGHYGVCCSR